MTLSIARNTVAAGAVALLVSSPAGLATAAETELNVVGNISITTQFKNLEKPFWTEQLAAWSDGKVTAQFQGWNEMGLKGPEVFRLLQKGVMDVGTYQLGHVSGEAPINDATDLAGLSPSLDKFLEVTHASRPVLEQTYADRFGLKILTMQSFQAQLLYCRGELRGLADLKGKKIRTSGASQSDFVSHFGGQGVPMAFGEVQQGLQRGVIDCAITGTLGGVPRQVARRRQIPLHAADQLRLRRDRRQRAQMGRARLCDPEHDRGSHRRARGGDVAAQPPGRRNRHRLQHDGAMSIGPGSRHDPGRSQSGRPGAAASGDAADGAAALGQALRQRLRESVQRHHRQGHRAERGCPITGAVHPTSLWPIGHSAAECRVAGRCQIDIAPTLWHIPLAMRVSFAAHRQTTRIGRCC